MPRIDQIIVNRILEAADIVDVVGDFVTLTKKGVRYIGCCPFHEDRHAGSFVVYPKKKCFKCFVCDKKGDVVKFLRLHENFDFPDAIRWLGKKYNIETDMQDFNYTPPPPRPAPPSLEMLVLPFSMVKRTEAARDADRLVVWLSSIKWDSAQRARINECLRDYHIGHSKQGMTIFWQIDERMQVRTGKMMRYKPDGHRDRSDGYNFDWIHSALSRKKNDNDPWPHPELFNPDKQEMVSCLFGLHLLDRYKTNQKQQVCIVESEKTALLMAIAYGNNQCQVWMACGGVENINRDKLEQIIDQKRDIILYPDRDGIAKWKAKAENLHYDRVMVDVKPVTEWWKPEDGEKADIADVVTRMIQNKRVYKTADEIIEDMPQLKALHEKFNLELEK